MSPCAHQVQKRRRQGQRAREAARRRQRDRRRRTPGPGAALIGIDPAVGFAPLHVHDTSGVIHVESPTVRGYTLGQFFAVWGVRFTPSCLGGYCAGGPRRLRVFVDGTAVRGDPTALALEPHQEIVVAFGTAAQLPSPIPSTYRFPPGE